MKIPFTEVFADETKNGTKLKTSDYQTSGTYPIIDQGQDFIAGYTDSENGLYTDVPAIIFGDHTRVLKYVDFPFFLGADGAKILKARKAHANYRYLYYALKSVRIPDTGYNRHFKWLKEATVSISDSQNQESIVFTLDSISRIISHRKSQLAKLDELVKCRFVELFIGKGYPRRELQSLIQDGTSISYGIVQPGDDGTGNIGLLRPVDFHNGSVVLDNLKYIGEAISNLSRKTILEGNELLITVRGTTGLTALTNSNHRGMNVTRGIAVVKYDGRKIVPEYLQAVMSSDESQTYIREHTRGATLQQINLSDLRIQSILVPPLVEQQTFADFVSRIDKLRFVEKSHSLVNSSKTP